MPNTYTQILIHIIYAVKGRQNLITESHRDELEKYITGIASAKKCKVLAIYCNPDHIHIFVGLHPNSSVSDLVKVIKSNSSKFINERRWLVGRFEWQEGFAAISHNKSQLDTVVKYILEQKSHHNKRTFREEYLEIMQQHEIEFDDRYLFNFID